MEADQINFKEDMKKTKFSKLKKVQIMPKVKFTQPTQKKEYYLMIHNKIKINYLNREYKSVYEKLTNIEKPDPTYLFSYYEDLAYASIKMLGQFIIHKQINSNTASEIEMYTHKCKDTIYKLYKLFTLDQQLINQRKSINLQRENQITRFLNLIISFTLYHSLICFMQNRSYKSKNAYEFLYSICTNIITSSTSNYKILRKVGQSLIVYAVYLIENNEINQAIKILFECLKNEMNLLIILSYRLKEKSRRESKRRRLQIYNRLYAIFFNLTHCFHSNRQLQWCYICLRECQMISDLKGMLLQKDIKISWQQILKTYSKFYDEYKQIKVIVGSYFNESEVRDDLNTFKKRKIQRNSLEEEAYKQLMSVNSYQKSNKIVQKKKKPVIRRSVSLQQNLNFQKNKKQYKDFGQQILFFGYSLLQTNHAKTKSQKMGSKQNLNQTQKSNVKETTTREISTKIINNNSSKIKKSFRKIESALFRKIQQPIEYNTLQDKFQKIWIEQQRINNGYKQKKCLLKYKSQYLNYKQIAQENTNIYQEIQVVKKKNEFPFKQMKKNNQVQQQQKEKGIDLFKKIILKHSKRLQIKKTQTFNALKKKRKSHIIFNSFSSPDNSVNFLLQRVKKQKERVQYKDNKMRQAQMQRKQRQRHKVTTSAVFLTKDTVQIPNLFLSYITSSGSNGQFPTNALQLNHKSSEAFKII